MPETINQGLAEWAALHDASTADATLNILSLPVELLDEITTYLPPVAALAFSSTCKAAAIHMHRLALLIEVLEEPKLRYEFHCLGERDRHSGGHFACDYCTVVHEKSRFHPSVARLRAFGETGDRTCIAGLTSVELFPNFWFSHQDLRKFVSWCKDEPVLDARRSLRVTVERMQAFASVEPGRPAIEAIKLAFRNQAIPLASNRGPSTPAVMLGFSLHSSNLIVAHMEYSLVLDSLQQATRPSTDAIASDLVKQNYMICTCPHFKAPSYSSSFLTKVQRMYSTHLRLCQARRLFSTLVQSRQTTRLSCRECSSYTKIRLHRFWSPQIKSFKTCLHLEVVRELGPPDQADNILWVSQLPSAANLKPD